MPPRPYQTPLIPAILGAFRAGHRRVLFTMATGAGKTFVAGSLAPLSARKGRRVMFITDRQDLTDQAHGAIGGAGLVMGARSEDPAAPVITTTWQTLARRPDLLAALSAGPWLVIIDEADRWATGMVALLSDLPPGCLVLGMTATPARSAKGEGLSMLYDHLVAGPTPVALLADGWLTPFSIFEITGPSDGRLDTSEAMECAYQGWLPYRDRPTLGICRTKEHARKMAELWASRGHWSAVVLADTPNRRELYRRVAAGGALFGVDVPGRGVDIPALSALLVCRRLQSWAGILQEQGRLTRLCRPCAKCGEHIQWGHNDCWICAHVHTSEPSGWKPRGVLLDQAGNWIRARLDLVSEYEMDEPAVTTPGLQPARLCPACRAVVALTARACPECGQEMPPPELRPEAVGAWREVGEEDQRWQWAVEEARVMGRQPAWVWRKLGAPGGESSPDLEPLRRAIARLSPPARQRWVERVRERQESAGKKPWVWMAARVGFR